MGLLRRSRGAEKQEQGNGKKSFGHAAFDPADVEDARRDHPAVALSSVIATLRSSGIATV